MMSGARYASPVGPRTRVTWPSNLGSKLDAIFLRSVDGRGKSFGPTSFSVCPSATAMVGSTPQIVMAKRIKQLPQERGFVLFDVIYEDGSQASNRRVPVEVLGSLDGDEPARRVVEEQDEAIAQSQDETGEGSRA